MLTMPFNFAQYEWLFALLILHNALYGYECRDVDLSAVKSDNFGLPYKMLTAVKAGLKITLLFLFSSPPLVLSSGRTFTFFIFFFSFSKAWAWPPSWELAQLDPLFSFPLLANFPDNWSRMQTERERGFESDAKAWQSVSALCNGCA